MFLKFANYLAANRTSSARNCGN